MVLQGDVTPGTNLQNVINGKISLKTEKASFKPVICYWGRHKAPFSPFIFLKYWGGGTCHPSPPPPPPSPPLAEIFFGITWQKILVTKPVKVAKPSRGIFIAGQFRKHSGFGPRTANFASTVQATKKSLVMKRLVLFDI